MLGLALWCSELSAAASQMDADTSPHCTISCPTFCQYTWQSSVLGLSQLVANNSFYFDNFKKIRAYTKSSRSSQKGQCWAEQVKSPLRLCHPVWAQVLLLLEKQRRMVHLRVYFYLFEKQWERLGLEWGVGKTESSVCFTLPDSTRAGTRLKQDAGAVPESSPMYCF